MASSNKHWPSMFKSKPNNTFQWQHHDINSTAYHRNPYTPGPGCEERNPEPKPRWNPRPEQIRILESIFNSGMVNPPRDEIRKIRAQLQEYGQVGDANVFYWFQNRKSRSKHKQRQLTQNNKSHQTTSSSSSSSDKSSQNNNSKNVEKALSVSSSSAMNIDLLTEPLFYPVRQNSGGRSICFPDVSSSSCGADQSVGNCSSVLLRELMLMRDGNWKKGEDEKMRLQEQLIYGVTTVVDHTADHFVPPPPTNHLLPGAGLAESSPPKTTIVFINDVCFEVAMGQFNVRETFGDDVVLLQSTGQPVLTNEWGLTQQPLQHGAFYYLIRTYTSSPDDNTIHLI